MYSSYKIVLLFITYIVGFLRRYKWMSARSFKPLYSDNSGKPFIQTIAEQMLPLYNAVSDFTTFISFTSPIV